jgi:DNA excision repair protein ERCC-4
MRTARPKPTEHVFPGTVVIDSREGLPYAFTGIVSDAKDGRLPVRVTTIVRGLPSGDYSLEGFENRVAVERKSLGDLFSTLGGSRDRFQRELARLAEMEHAAVVIEAEWSTIYRTPPERSQLPPKNVLRSVIAWQQRFPSIHWHFVPGRAFAERLTFRILERFWKTRNTSLERQKGQPKVSQVSPS